MVYEHWAHLPVVCGLTDIVTRRIDLRLHPCEK